MSRLARQLPRTGWETGGTENGNAEWLRLIDFAEPERSLGVLRDGTWILAFNRDGSLHLHEPGRDAAVAILPVLHLELDEVEDLVRSKLEVPPFAEERLFPIDLVYQSALRSRSAYWIGAAVKWMEQALPSEEHHRSLEETAGMEHIDQRTRHRLKRLLKQMAEVRETR